MNLYTIDIDTSKLKVVEERFGKAHTKKHKMARHIREKKHIKRAASEGTFNT